MNIWLNNNAYAHTTSTINTNIFHYMLTPSTHHQYHVRKIHQQHICTYTYIIHQHHHHSNSTTIIMIINKHHHNQHQNIITSIINIHININNITTNQQLHIISHSSSKGENTPHYDEHTSYSTPINHSHIFIPSYPIITKIYARYSVLKIIFDKVRLSFHNFKTTMAIESKLRKQTQLPQLCIHINHIWVQLCIHARFTGQIRWNRKNHKVRHTLSFCKTNSLSKEN